MAAADRILAEGMHAGEFIVSEAAGTRSRDQVTIAAQLTLKAGHVLSKLASGGQWTEYDNSGGTVPDGTEKAAGILLEAVTTGTGETAQAVVLLRDCEVNGGELTWHTGLSTADIAAGIADLALLGVIVRTALTNL
jgi:Bacteriophage lambda head decoration protein D